MAGWTSKCDHASSLWPPWMAPFHQASPSVSWRWGTDLCPWMPLFCGRCDGWWPECGHYQCRWIRCVNWIHHERISRAVRQTKCGPKIVNRHQQLWFSQMFMWVLTSPASGCWTQIRWCFLEGHLCLQRIYDLRGNHTPWYETAKELWSYVLYGFSQCPEDDIVVTVNI